jgi:hypothetical protein
MEDRHAVGGALLSGVAIEIVVEAHLRLFKQIEDLNHAWSESVQRAREAETDFAHRMMGCSDPAKAAELCTEWLAKRAAAFLTETQRFTGLWLNFYSDAVKEAWNGAAVTARPPRDAASAEAEAAQ